MCHVWPDKINESVAWLKSKCESNKLKKKRRGEAIYRWETETRQNWAKYESRVPVYPSEWSQVLRTHQIALKMKVTFGGYPPIWGSAYPICWATVRSVDFTQCWGRYIFLQRSLSLGNGKGAIKKSRTLLCFRNKDLSRPDLFFSENNTLIIVRCLATPSRLEKKKSSAGKRSPSPLCELNAPWGTIFSNRSIRYISILAMGFHACNRTRGFSSGCFFVKISTSVFGLHKWVATLSISIGTVCI